MAQPINDYTVFFREAKQAVQELEELQQKSKMLEDLEHQLEVSLKNKKKEVADTIAQTVKKRSDEITKSYDTEIGKTQDRIRKVKGKREKARSQGEKERIAEETKGLYDANDEIKSQIKAVFQANHVPKICASNLYFSLYFTKGLKEFMVMLAALLLIFLALPVGVYFLIPNRQVLYLVLIYVAVILVFGGIYVKIGNATKMKHMDALKQACALRDTIKANKKQIKKIEKSIRRDKDEGIYNLQLFDDEIAQLEQDMAQAERQKKEALNTFNNVTKTIISDEISGNYQQELDQMESDLARTKADLRATQNAEMAKALYITDNYEIYAGKEFMIVDKLGMLEEIIETGKASNISDAITVYKGKEYSKKVSE